MSEEYRIRQEEAERLRREQQKALTEQIAAQKEREEAQARLAEARRVAAEKKAAEPIKAGYMEYAESRRTQPSPAAVKAGYKEYAETKEPGYKVIEGYKQYAETQKPGYAVTQAAASIAAAETAIKQAGSLTEAWGAKIQWGNRDFDLGTTEGWKGYKQAVRDAKSDINKAKNTLKRYESAKWEEKTSEKAKEAIEKANKVIEDANKIIKEQNANIEKIAAANKRLVETQFGHKAERLTPEQNRAHQVKETYNYLTAFIVEDLADTGDIVKAISSMAPIYVTTPAGSGEFEKWMDQLEELKRDAEKRAEWKAQQGISYKDRMKPENRPTVKQLTARLEHIGLTMGQAGIYALPIAGATMLGGPLASGIVVAGTVATFADPRTRWGSSVFVGEHPEEFFASIAGALAAGMAVSTASKIWNQYSTKLKVADAKKFAAKMDKLIDDYAYLEQIKGAEYPSQVEKAAIKARYIKDYPNFVKKLDKLIDDYAYGEQLKGTEFPSRVDHAQTRANFIRDYPDVFEKLIDDYTFSEQLKGAEFPSTLKEENIFNNFVKNLSPDELAQYIKSVKEDWAIYYDSGGQILEPVFVKKLISMYPELRDPFLHPAFTDPNVLAKSNLVAKITDTFKHPALTDPNVLNRADIVARLNELYQHPGLLDPSVLNRADLVARGLPANALSTSPLLVAALSIVAQQGYITDTQIRQLIAENTKLIELYEQAGIQIQEPISIQELESLTLSDYILILNNLSLETVTPYPESTIPLVPIPISEPVPPEEPPPPEPDSEPPPDEPGPGRTDKPLTDKEKDILDNVKRRLSGFGPKERYKVKFSYPTGRGETVVVQARSFPEAVNKGQRIRRSNKYLPSVCDVVRV